MRHGFLAFLILLVSFSNVAGQDISYDVTIELSAKSAHEQIIITVNNSQDIEIEEFSYNLPSDAVNISVYDAVGVLEKNISHEEGVSIVSRFRNQVKMGDIETVIIEFDTDELISSSQEGNIFSAIFFPLGRMNLRVALPPGFGLSKPVASSAQTDIAPLPDRTTSDGTKTIFEWDVESLKEFALLIRYDSFNPPLSPAETKEPPISLPPPPEEAGVYSLELLVAIIVVLAVGGFLLNYKRKLIDEQKVDKTTEFMREDEKIIIDLIREDEGIVQRRLVDLTGFSKAKISKIVSDLNKRNIVFIERIGRRNKLFLTEEFKKK